MPQQKQSMSAPYNTSAWLSFERAILCSLLRTRCLKPVKKATVTHPLLTSNSNNFGAKPVSLFFAKSSGGQLFHPSRCRQILRCLFFSFDAAFESERKKSKAWDAVPRSRKTIYRTSSPFLFSESLCMRRNEQFAANDFKFSQTLRLLMSYWWGRGCPFVARIFWRREEKSMSGSSDVNDSLESFQMNSLFSVLLRILSTIAQRIME